MDLDQKWKLKEEKNFLKDEEKEEERIWQYHRPQKRRENKSKLMRSKIIALSRNEEFKTLLKEKKISNKYVTIFFGILKNKNINKLNVSFVTKKKIGNAVKRNKIRRRLKYIFYNAMNEINIKLKYSYLVIAKPTMLNNDYTNIKETLFKELKKIK